jgi:hypothetical protein
VCGLPAQHCVCHDCSCCDVQGARTEREACTGCNCGGSVSTSSKGFGVKTRKIMDSHPRYSCSEQPLFCVFLFALPLTRGSS